MHRRRSISRAAVAVTAVASLAFPFGFAQSAGAAATRTISYRGVEVDVPAAWPVVDLADDPARCARTDDSVVYLGHQGADALCPSVVVGAAESVHLEPWDARTDPAMRDLPRGNHKGEPARVERARPESGRAVIAFERPRTIVRVAFGEDRALAEEIAASARVTSAPPSTPAGTAGPMRSSPAPLDPPPPTSAALPDFTAAQTQPAPLQPGIFAGEGFDTCANPALNKMQAWWLASPYRAIGIYVGGVNHGCKAQDLSADWVASAARIGWSFWPLYVGRQAPCYSGSTSAKISLTPSTAAAQGREAANDAIAQADKFRLPTGSPLYFDMEAYPGNDTACRDAVYRFMDAWTDRLHERGYLSGFYSSEASGIDDMSAAYDNPGISRPDAVWTAHWDEPKRIFGHNQDWLPDSQWRNHQRIHQYEGGHVETWGGQQINIDNDYADAPAVRFKAAQRWLTGNFDGTGGTDIVHLCCSDYVNTWLSQGNGTFTVTSFRPWSRYGLQLGGWLVLDLNNDDRSDLVHLCCADSVRVWMSDGDGTFTVTGFSPWAGYVIQQGRWIAGEMNGDGNIDLVHLCCSDSARIWLSNGNGTFTLRSFRPWTGYVLQQGGWAASDLDADGDTDLVHFCCSDSTRVWLSDGDGTFTVLAFRPWPGYGIQQGRWIVSDHDGDGDGDLVHLCCSDSARIWLSNGNGTFTVAGFRPWAGYGLQQGRWVPSDVNGDGEGDLVHLCCADSVRVWTSNGNGTYTVSAFRPWVGYQLQAGSWHAADMNADGNGDLYHFCCASRILIWISKTDGTYQVVASPI